MVRVKFHSIRKKYSRTIITYITEHWSSINIYKQKIYEHRCYYFFSLYKRIERRHGKSSIESRLDTAARFQPPNRQTINPER